MPRLASHVPESRGRAPVGWETGRAENGVSQIEGLLRLGFKESSVTEPTIPHPSTMAARFSSVALHDFTPFPAATSVTQTLAHAVRAYPTRRALVDGKHAWSHAMVDLLPATLCDTPPWGERVEHIRALKIVDLPRWRLPTNAVVESAPVPAGWLALNQVMHAPR